MPFHQFGIIDAFDKNKDYSLYELQKYNCVDVDDEIIEDWREPLESINTYFHSYSRPAFALAQFGVTLIPSESLEQFYDIVLKDKRFHKSEELINLIALLKEAISGNKYVIHYGI